MERDKGPEGILTREGHRGEQSRIGKIFGGLGGYGIPRGRTVLFVTETTVVRWRTDGGISNGLPLFSS